MSKDYQGWENHETWVTNLELSNEEKSYKVIRYWIKYRDWTRRKETEYTIDVIALADRIKGYYHDRLPIVSGLYGALLISAFQSVNWLQIADHWIADYMADNPRDMAADYQKCLQAARYYVNHRIGGDVMGSWDYMQQVDRYLPD